MEKNSYHRVLGALATSLLFALCICGSALGQEMQVSGTVNSSTGEHLWGVTVRVQGTNTRTVTDQQGRYSINAPGTGVLTFALIGYRGVQQEVAGRSTIDLVMEQNPTVLEEVIVTGYSTQRRGDITGAVSSVNVENAVKQTSASVLQKLDGRIPGVTVDASGSPGSRSTVRIRGVSSFQNSDPLYIIDGTPVDGTSDSYINWLNPNDIGEIQVLKDASAASIYGSRASNGVVIIETKKGRPGGRQVRLDVRTGVASPVHGYDEFLLLNPLKYAEIMKQSYLNAGYPIDSVPKNIFGDPNAQTLPAYIWPNNGKTQTGDTLNTASYAYPSSLIMRASPGTNWWDAVFGPALTADANLGISGGGADNAYNVSFSYLRQGGTAAYNEFLRGTARVNTAFNIDKVTVGENLAFSREQAFGGLANDPGGYAEDGILGKNILMQPVVPIYDIGGHFASGKAVSLGNQTNPLKYAWARKDDRNTTDRILGNVFAGLDVMRALTLRTKLGFNLGQNTFRGFTPARPEDSEPSNVNGITENYSRSTDWTWTNTLNYLRTEGRHNFALLVGHEANENTDRLIAGGISGLLNEDPASRYINDALGSASSKTVTSSGSIGKLLSFFGKADYNFAEKYYVSVTVRRDGSSRLGPSHRWGTFPAFNIGWRPTQESFMAGNRTFSNVMLRFGWGVTGNQRIPAGRIVRQFGGSRGDTFYDIGGTGTTVQPGFRETFSPNLDLKWEENTSVNFGVDLEFLAGRGTFTADFYNRETDNLLFDPPNPGTAGVAAPAIVNIGKMRNRGLDFAVGYSSVIGDGKIFSLNFNGSHYKNQIVRIDGEHTFFYGPVSTRFGNQIINMVGEPIGSFYGLIAEGFFRDAADVASHAVQGSGAKPGQLKFRDLNGDGQITQADRTVIGSPHPDFTAGLDLGLRWGAWDFSATLFGTFGNEIFDVQKEFYIFRNFSTNVRNDLLEESWTPSNLDAKYPRLDVNDAFSRQLSSYYVESGSYVRLRNLQIGWAVPASLVRWIPAARIYLQAENLFTITGYDGLDPSLPAANIFGPAGDIRDQYRGIDRGTYPSSKTISVGISTTF